MLFTFKFFKFSERIKPVQLAIKELKIGTEVVVTGWGNQNPVNWLDKNVKIRAFHAQGFFSWIHKLCTCWLNLCTSN